jgi:hypothetical protein
MRRYYCFCIYWRWSRNIHKRRDYYYFDPYAKQYGFETKPDKGYCKIFNARIKLIDDQT